MRIRGRSTPSAGCSRSGPGDVDQDVLAAGGEDRVVERLVAGRLAHPLARQVFGHQRRQDTDHHDVGAGLVGLGLRRVEAGPHLGFELQSRAARQRPRWNVEFDVVGAQFGLIGRVGDRRQHVRVAHRRLVVAVDQVALDLHAGQRPFELEAGLGEHRFEDVQAQLYLAPVFTAVRATEVDLLHLFAHNADATHSVTRAQQIANSRFPPLRERAWLYVDTRPRRYPRPEVRTAYLPNWTYAGQVAFTDGLPWAGWTIRGPIRSFGRGFLTMRRAPSI